MATILIMEDDPSEGGVYKRALESMGHEVSLATSATAALAEMAETAFDLLLTDLFVPRTANNRPDGGIALIGRIRVARSGSDVTQLKTSPRLPIIAMTGATEAPAVVANPLDSARAVGADRVLKKPFDLSTLFACVDECLDGR
ncbi:MAG: response regulator [Burkholderiaceae bacterium]